MDADAALPLDYKAIAPARTKQIGMNALWHVSEKS
jgi:hypothetical protein